MSNKKKSKNAMIFANRTGLADEIRKWVGDRFVGKPYCIVCVSDNAQPGNMAFGFPPPARGDFSFTRGLVVFEGLPIDLENVGRWRGWAMAKGAWDLRMTFLQGDDRDANIRELVEKTCASWAEAVPTRETPAITKGQFVRLPPKPTAKDDPSLLTMMFGSMGDLMTQVDIVARCFRQCCPVHQDKKRIKEYLSKVDKLLAAGKPERDDNEPQPYVEDRTDLPRLLLRGDTGVGKTLIARYLHRNCGFDGRPLRVPIPEYLGKEDMFEYDLMGYARGAYTGGTEEGRHGLLLENVGGVVFFDEIGEANSILQAKLLAYLDDYRIRPRKWEGTPFYCPTLVVAATNKDLHEMVDEGTFRPDLLARFTDRHPIPALKDRTEELPFILDCLLQRESINPKGKIEEVGEEAYDSLEAHGFEEGNFRQLEDILRAACHRAARDGLDYLTKKHFQESGNR